MQKWVLKPVPVVNEGPARIDPNFHLRVKQPEVWRDISGIVQDTQGRPVKQATVFAVDPSRRGIQVFQAITDDKGKYNLTGLPDGRALEVNIVACKPGSPPAFDTVLASELVTEVADLVLPEVTGTLTIQVQDEQGQPAANIPVKIIPEFATRIVRNARRDNPVSPANRALDKMLLPCAMTDGSGRVHFAALLPGRYYVSAGIAATEEPAEYRENDPLGIWHLPDHDSKQGIGYGIAVAPGKVNQFLVRLQQANANVSIRYLLPGGGSYKLPGVPVWYIAASNPENLGAKISSPASQTARETWEIPMASGVQRILVGIKPPPIDIAPEEFVLSNSTVLAISPYRPRHEPIKLHTMVLSPDELKKQKLDEHGYPAMSGGGGTFGGGPSRSVEKLEKTPAFSKIRILLPDGKTPAAGACAFINDPLQMYGNTYYQVNNTAYYADGNGHLKIGGFTSPHYHNAVWPQNSVWEKKSEDSKTGQVIALLPGAYGAAFIPLSRLNTAGLVRVVLPPALSVTGRVFVGNKPLRPSVAGVVRVLALSMSHGDMNKLLSVETVAQSDGTFTISGLTPGEYIIQAALDDIWCSSYTRITVQVGHSTASVPLHIPMPGKPVVISLGREYAGTKATLVDTTDPGPLNERYTPAFYVADGAGELRLEGLTAGTHQFRLEAGKIINATVPADK